MHSLHGAELGTRVCQSQGLSKDGRIPTSDQLFAPSSPTRYDRSSASKAIETIPEGVEREAGRGRARPKGCDEHCCRGDNRRGYSLDTDPPLWEINHPTLTIGGVAKDEPRVGGYVGGVHRIADSRRVFFLLIRYSLIHSGSTVRQCCHVRYRVRFNEEEHASKQRCALTTSAAPEEGKGAVRPS